MDYRYDGAAEELNSAARGGAVIVVDDHEVGGNLLNSREDLSWRPAPITPPTRPSGPKNSTNTSLCGARTAATRFRTGLSRYLKDRPRFRARWFADEASLVELAPLYPGQQPRRLYYQRVSRPASVRIGEAGLGSGFSR